MHRYTEEQKEFIKSIAEGTPRKVIQERFNERFGANVSVRSIGGFMSRNGIKNNMQGYATRLQKGHEPWNKGMKGLDLGGEAGWFKKGESVKALPVGSERYKEYDDEIKIKVAQPNVWVPKHRYIWEQAHGPIPEGHVILFKDNNPRNTTIDNLFMVKRTAMTSVAKRKLRSEHPAINTATHYLAELELTIRKKEDSQ